MLPSFLLFSSDSPYCCYYSHGDVVVVQNLQQFGHLHFLCLPSLSLFVYFLDLEWSICNHISTYTVTWWPCSWLSVGSTQRRMMMMMLLEREKKKSWKWTVFAPSFFFFWHGFLWRVCMVTMQFGYHHQLNAQIYSKTEMMMLFRKGKKKLKMNRFCTQLVFSHMEFSLWSVHWTTFDTKLFCLVSVLAFFFAG